MYSRSFSSESQRKSCAANTCQPEVWDNLNFSNRSKEQGGNKHFDMRKPQGRVLWQSFSMLTGVRGVITHPSCWNLWGLCIWSLLPDQVSWFSFFKHLDLLQTAGSALINRRGQDLPSRCSSHPHIQPHCSPRPCIPQRAPSSQTVPRHSLEKAGWQ